MFSLRCTARSVAVFNGKVHSPVSWQNPNQVLVPLRGLGQKTFTAVQQLRVRRPLSNSYVRRLQSYPVNKVSTVSTAANVTVEGDFLALSWENNTQSKFHHIWLRDHCRCQECYNHDTHQREADILQIPLDIKPSRVELVEGKEVKITWPDEHTTVYSADWLRKHTYSGTGEQSQGNEFVLWNSSIASNLPESIKFEEAIHNDAQLFELSQRIVRYGFAFLEETPCNLEAIESISNKLGGFVKETHYGRLWDFGRVENNLEFADTAFTSQAIRCHTDGTYFMDPAGLQLLHCTGHNGTGGMSLLVDGYNAAEILRQTDQDSFHYLSKTIIPFHYFEEGKLHLKAHGPVIELDPYSGRVSRIRYNPHDLAPLDCFLANDVPRFYKAFKAFTAIVRAPENEFQFKLSPGKLLIMANWKVLHGRLEFTGNRSMNGCYVSRDDFLGKLRIMKKQKNW